MKNLVAHSLNPVKGRSELKDLQDLLRNEPILKERKHVLPFFKNRYNLSLLISNYFPKIISPDRFAHEYQIYGDFVADLIVGDASSHKYVLVEFENGDKDSIFKKKQSKSTPDWSPRFEGAYSQLTDWLWKLEDMRSTVDFQNTFGNRRATFQGLIVIGKDMNLSQQEEDRLKWRMDKTLIDSNAISVVSFNQLHDDIDFWLSNYHSV